MDLLVSQLHAGPLDVVGDVHGEFQALRKLLHRLGYCEAGRHPENRRLVFVGDLIDRGPESPAVVDYVQRLVRAERAQCILGNHEFNVILGQRKPQNLWFFGESCQVDTEPLAFQGFADESTRQRHLSFFRSLPLALERPDLRVVHACWQSVMINAARQADDVETLYDEYTTRINQECQRASNLDEVDRRLQLQNRNPVTVITSGPICRTSVQGSQFGAARREPRVPWWNDYQDVFCVFGHYSLRFGERRGNSRAFCVDYGIGKRWMERRADVNRPALWKLAAIRIPERVVYFDDGSPSMRVADG